MLGLTSFENISINANACTHAATVIRAHDAYEATGELDAYVRLMDALGSWRSSPTYPVEPSA